MLTNVRTGAAFPSIDPAGEWLYFSGYHVDGWEVERVRFAPAAALPAPAPAARFDEAGAVSEAATGDASAWLARTARLHRCRGPRPRCRQRLTGRYWGAGRRRPGWNAVPRPGEPGPRLLTAVDPVSEVLAAGVPGAPGDREDDRRGRRGAAHGDSRLRGRRPHLGLRPRPQACLRGRGTGLHVGRPGRGRRVVRVSGPGEPDHRRDRLADVGRRRRPGAPPGNGSGGLARDLLRPGTGAAAGHVGARAPARRAYVDVTEVLGRAGPERPGSAG